MANALRLSSMVLRPDSSLELSWMRRALAPHETLWYFARGERATKFSELGRDFLKFARNVGQDARDHLAREGVLKTLAKLAAVAAVDSLFIQDPSTSFADVLFRDDERRPRRLSGDATSEELTGGLVGLTQQRLIVIGTGIRSGPTGYSDLVPLWMASFLPHQIGPSTVHVRKRSLGPLVGRTLVLGEGKEAIEFTFGWPEDIEQMKAIADRLVGCEEPGRGS